MTRAPTKKQRRKEAFGDDYVLVEKYVEGKKTARTHFLTIPAADAIIKRESERLSIPMGDYIIFKALSFKTRGIIDLLNSTVLSLDQFMKANNITLKKGETLMNEVTNFKKNLPANVKTEQYHLRVTPEAYEKLASLANEYSMSISDYITFVVCHFDISEISSKVEEINSKLDAICEKGVLL